MLLWEPGITIHVPGARAPVNDNHCKEIITNEAFQGLHNSDYLARSSVDVVLSNAASSERKDNTFP